MTTERNGLADRLPPGINPDVLEIVAGLFLIPAEFSNEVTLGSWLSEEESAREFDARVLATGCFTIHREVAGQYLQPKLGSTGEVCRIDRVLMPTAKLRSAGWPHGPVGVELEASARKIAGPLAQAMDYSRAVFRMKDPPGYNFWLEWIAIWPWAGSKGNIASLACQHRVCGAFIGHRARFVLTDGSANALVCRYDGTVEAKAFKSGSRVGHRARS